MNPLETERPIGLFSSLKIELSVLITISTAIASAASRIWRRGEVSPLEKKYVIPKATARVMGMAIHTLSPTLSRNHAMMNAMAVEIGRAHV